MAIGEGGVLRRLVLAHALAGFALEEDESPAAADEQIERLRQAPDFGAGRFEGRDDGGLGEVAFGGAADEAHGLRYPLTIG